MADKKDPKVDFEEIHFEPAAKADSGVNFEEAAPESTKDKILRYASQALQGVGKGASYLEGAVSGPITGAALEAATGKKVNNADEYLDALNPTNLKQFPTLDEQLERAGVPKGATMSDIPGLQEHYAPPGLGGFMHPEKGGILDFSVRGTGAEAGSILRDPLTYLSLGAVPGLKKLGKVGEAALAAARAPRTAVKTVGEKLFDMGSKDLIQAGARKGKTEVGRVLRETGVVGPSAEAALRQHLEKQDLLLAARDKILDEAGDNGARVSRAEAFKPLSDYLTKAVADERLSPEAAKELWEAIAQPSVRRSSPLPKVASQWKTDTSKMLSDAARDTMASSNIRKEASEAGRAGLQKAVETSAGARGAEVADINEKLGTLLSTQKAARRVAEKESVVPPLGWSDLAVAGGGSAYGASTGAIGGMEALMIKRALQQAIMTPYGRRFLGNTLYKAGKNPASGAMIDLLTRQTLKPPSQAKDQLDFSEETDHGKK